LEEELATLSHFCNVAEGGPVLAEFKLTWTAPVIEYQR
jgi:hypothetical protein